MQLDFTSVYIIHFDFILVLLQFIFWKNDVYISIFQIKVFRLGSSERVLSSHPLSQRSTTLLGRAVIDYLYLYKYEIVCLSVCLFAFFSAISKPIGIPFGTKLLFIPGKFLKQYYLKKCFKRYCPFSLFLYDFSVNLKSDNRKNKLDRNLILF